MGKKKGRSLNPTDAYRKQLRKKELQKAWHLWAEPFLPFFLQNKKDRKKARELHTFKNDPKQIEEQLQQIENQGV